MISKEFLKKTFLFKGVAEEALNTLLANQAPRVVNYKRGEIVYSSADERLVGFIVSGECEIRRDKHDGSRVVLNLLHENDSFGILSVFSNEEFPTQIFALRSSEILYFSEAQIKHFVNNDLQIATNLIDFLVGRVNFLNKKIATFSGTRVEDRLSAFLLCQADEYCCNSFPFNCQKTSEEINAGRASVYRAIATLEAAGLIKLENKKIYIIDRKGLERNTK